MSKQTLLWESPAWREEAIEWIRSLLAERNMQLRGEIEQPHIRPWSTVMRVPTDGGTVFFKASAPYLAHEAGVTEYLTYFRPELFPELYGTDRGRGWMLMADAGVPLRQHVRSEKSFARWDAIMPLFAQLQKDLAAHTRDLLALGMMDRRLEVLPQLFEGLLSDEPAMMVGLEDGLTAEQYKQLQRSVPEFREMCERLRAAGIPESIHHDDFHDANIFLRDGRVLFTDWAESAVTHPFLSLVVMLRGAGNSLEMFYEEEGFEAGPDTPEIAALRELYLRSWSEYGSMEELLGLARIAERKVGYVNRALTWAYVISHLPPEMRTEYAGAVPAYMQEYLSS
jgi:hypothetical protein